MSIFLKSAAVATFIGLVIWGYVSEIETFSNTFQIRYLFFRAMFVGGFVGAILGRKMAQQSDDTTVKLRYFMSILFAGLFTFPLLAVMTNRVFAQDPPLSMPAVFLKQEPLIMSRFGITKNDLKRIDAYYVYFRTPSSDVDRIRSKQPFQRLEKDTPFELQIKKGFWGFDVATF